MRSQDSPHRLYCSHMSFMFTREDMKEANRLDVFSKQMPENLGRDKGRMDLKGYDLVFFPLLENGHYYVIVFELKNPAIYIPDNMHEDETVVSMKDDANYFKKDTPYKVASINKTF
ncbi:hypothetical protein L1987_74339 [Smallanthus sonchifolius]|uniref:Uncharacterized protein n=1 Tax=Smallanthus sonchifolius TaxID=185202 RepID=A0ACB9A6U6_9ASTR|nr:hypothetical protein L1987_74339 [Smallanthus sonchifolius]